MDGLKRWLRQPLLHFLLIGICLFVLFGLINGPTAYKTNSIVITTGSQKLLEEKFLAAWSRPPNSKEKKTLIENYLRDEVFYREAISLGLDKGDDLIRRRLRQKMDFILADLSVLAEPSEEELLAYLMQHKDKFRTEPQVTFEHIYLSHDKRQDVSGDAEAILSRLKSGENSEQMGDQISLPFKYTNVTQSSIRRAFGEEFSQKVVELDLGVWSGPIASGYGGHIVLVTEYIEGKVPELSDIKEKVKQEWAFEKQNDLKEDAFHELLEGYEVVLEKRP